jgi:hypothetical protein
MRTRRWTSGTPWLPDFRVYLTCTITVGVRILLDNAAQVAFALKDGVLLEGPYQSPPILLLAVGLGKLKQRWQIGWRAKGSCSVDRDSPTEWIWIGGDYADEGWHKLHQSILFNQPAGP